MTDYYKPTEHSQKDDCNEMQYIDPDEVRIEKLNSIVERYYTCYEKSLNRRWTIENCFNRINCENEHYTPKEISDALLQYFVYDDIIQFLLTNYMENL